MKPHWIIEKNMVPDDHKLYDILEETNTKYTVLPYVPFQDCLNQEWLDECFYYDDKFFFYGSINLATKLLRQTRFNPLIFGDLTFNKDFDCTSYYPLLGKYLLNNKFAMMPFGSLLSNYGVTKFLSNGKLFIRPNSGLKSFAGQVVDYDKLKEFYDFYMNGPSNISSEELILVAPYYHGRFIEARMIVVDGMVVTGSYYGLEHTKHLIPSLPTDFFSEGLTEQMTTWVQNIVTQYNKRLPPALTIDVLYDLDYGRYYIIEINSLNCAGWYNSDYKKIVSAVNELLSRPDC